MRAAVVHAFGTPPSYTTFADPVATEGELPVRITAVGLHPVVKSMASGTHYASGKDLPFIPGLDGAGRLEDGSRVYFGMARSPFGTFAERGLAASWMVIPLPEGLDDATAAGIANPAMSSWAALKLRAQFASGESVIILGATGVAGQLAVQIAKRLGARRVVAAGRNPRVLERLKLLGADAVISLHQEHDQLVAAFRDAYAESGTDVVLDYVWGHPAESLLEAVSQKGMRKASRVRFVQIGALANGTISLSAAWLRSSGVEVMGSGFGSASLNQLRVAVEEFFRTAAERPFEFNKKTAPLSDVEALWDAPQEGSRLVFQP